MVLTRLARARDWGRMLALTDSALASLCHLCHGPQPDRRRALELLAASDGGGEGAQVRERTAHRAGRPEYELPT